MEQYNNDINNSKKTALKSKIYGRFTTSIALSAVLLLLTAIAAASPYISVVSGQLSPVQATGGNETTATTAPSGASLGPETGGGNATTTTTAGMQSACLSQNTTTTTTAESDVNANATTSADNTTTTVAPSGASIGSDDATTTVGTAGSMNVLAINQTAFQARMHVQEACAAIQNNDTQGALTDLNLATKSIDNILSNLTSTTTTTAGANQTSTTDATTGR
jgi:hypothetical protein